MSIDRRLHRLKEVRGDGQPTLIIYEADEDLSADDEAAFINASVPDISANALIVGIRRLAVTAPTLPRIVQIGSAGLTHEEALKHLRQTTEHEIIFKREPDQYDSIARFVDRIRAAQVST